MEAAAGCRCLLQESALRARMALISGLSLLTISSGAYAQNELQPFLTSNQNPFIQIYSVPPAQDAQLTGTGAWRIALQLDLTNNSIAEDDPAESIVLDGETYRSTLWLSYGVSDELEVGLAIPYVMQRQGVFDHFIEQWHDTFGLTNSKRTDFEENQLNYAYAGADLSLQVDKPAEGLGDIRLTLGFPIYKNNAEQSALAVHAGLKLPSGDAAKLLGSGGTDLALQLSATDGALLANWKSTLFWSVGVLRLGSGEVLETIRRDYVAIGSVGLSRPMTERIALKLQLDGQTSFYDSDLDALGSDAVQLIVGGQIALPGDSSLDLGLVENLFTDATPDLVFHLAWRAVL